MLNRRFLSCDVFLLYLLKKFYLNWSVHLRIIIRSCLGQFFQASLLPLAFYSNCCCRNKPYSEKEINYEHMKNRLKANLTFYSLPHSLFTIFVTLLFNKIKQSKETNMSYNNIENTFFQ